MSQWLLTLLPAVLLVGVLVWLFTRVSTPRYRLQREQVIRLLELVQDERATAADWTVFTGIPLRHDPELEALRLRCLDIEERYGEPRNSGRLFPPAAMQELKALLEELQTSSGNADS